MYILVLYITCRHVEAVKQLSFPFPASLRHITFAGHIYDSDVASLFECPNLCSFTLTNKVHTHHEHCTSPFVQLHVSTPMLHALAIRLPPLSTLCINGDFSFRGCARFSYLCSASHEHDGSVACAHGVYAGLNTWIHHHHTTLITLEYQTTGGRRDDSMYANEITKYKAITTCKQLQHVTFKKHRAEETDTEQQLTVMNLWKQHLLEHQLYLPSTATVTSTSTSGGNRNHLQTCIGVWNIGCDSEMLSLVARYYSSLTSVVIRPLPSVSSSDLSLSLRHLSISLRHLVLHSTHVDSSLISYLSVLTQLELMNTKITADAIKAIPEATPFITHITWTWDGQDQDNDPNPLTLAASD